MIKKLLKFVWKKLPPVVATMILRLILLLFGKKRDGTTNATEPIYVVGSFQSATGLGKGARQYVEHCKNIGKDVIVVDATKEMLQQCVLSVALDKRNWLSLKDIATKTGQGTIIIHANPPIFYLLLARLPSSFLQNKRIIAYWAWELERLPASYIMALNFVDAVEVPSSFTAQAVKCETNKEVTVHPHILQVPKQQKTSFCDNGILRCLYVFDMASGIERKNPGAAIAAFAKAFPKGEGASLTIKISQPGANNKGFSKLCHLAESTPGVRIVTGRLTAEHLEDLYLQHDVYISTHRSEGYGLTIREAMLYGLYVLATGWSGNMDFMSGPKVTALPYSLVPVPRGAMPTFVSNSVWADVDIDYTAKRLQELKLQLGGVDV